jgi:ATP-dependent protease ClpP protease subunit
MIEILKNSISSDVIYDEWVRVSKETFNKMSDSDLYSDKVQHIYFYSDIHNESVGNLQKLLMEASKTVVSESGIKTTPKPIVIHLSSQGGNTISMNIFNVFSQTQRLPLCVIIESECSSAATELQLLAPYRVIVDYSKYLIHDLAIIGRTFSKTANIVKTKTSIYNQLLNYIELLRKRTKLTNEEIDKFISRDLFIDSNYCLKHGIIDRILRFQKINSPSHYSNSSNLSLSIHTFLKKTNLNHIYIDSNEMTANELITSMSVPINLSEIKDLNMLCMELDNNFLRKDDNVKPLIIHFRPQEIFTFSNSNMVGWFNKLNYRLSLIQKKIPVIAFIEGSQSLDILGSILCCPIRIMMTPSIVSSVFTYSRDMEGFGWKVIDIMENTKFYMEQVVKYLKEKSKLPNQYYNDMRTKIINLSPETLLKYEIVHKVMKLHTKDMTPKNIIKYLHIDEMTAPFSRNARVKVRTPKTPKSMQIPKQKPKPKSS